MNTVKCEPAFPRSGTSRSVAFIYPPLFKYRVRFHEEVRRRLLAHNIEYRVLYCDPPPKLVLRNDTCDMPWATKTRAYRFNWNSREVIFQGAIAKLRGLDLIVMQQENRLLLNYFIHILRIFGTSRIAYFGHGRNFQSRNPGGISERFKRFIATRVDWWFAYNDMSARLVAGFGFPPERITSVQNSVDISDLIKEIASVGPDELSSLRATLGLCGSNVGIFIGGLYKEKRVPFLIDAAILIRQRMPDFELIVVGGGDEADKAKALAKGLDFIHFMGPQHGRKKTLLALLSKVFLLPGAVGLAVLDAFAYGLPIITIAGTFHGPEMDYLTPGVNGIVVEDASSTSAYADAVVGLLEDTVRQQEMAHAARDSSAQYSIDAMAENFVIGVLAALDC